jgi:hypothetical protein
VLYLEGSTDLAILRAFAEALDHHARHALERPFVHYIANQAAKAEEHFFGLREAKGDLVGMLILDRDPNPPAAKAGLDQLVWTRREIENYLCVPEALLSFAEEIAEQAVGGGPLFEKAEKDRYGEIMQKCIEDLVPPIALRDRNDQWWSDTKASDEFLDRLFVAFFRELRLPNLMRKSDYHQLARHVPVALLAQEISDALDRISRVEAKAKPNEDE